LPEYREKIEKIFRSPVFDEYGCNDGGLISYECNEHKGLHYAAEKTIVEVAEDNRPHLPGGYGEVILTDLYNYSMPFIKYKNGDIAKLSKSNCSCGRGLPLIESVHGRNGDILKFHERYIATPALTLIFKDFSLEQYQLIKMSDDLMIINAIKSKSCNPDDEGRLSKILKHHLGDKVDIQFNYVTHIETSASGKWKFFIDKSKSV
jgi:phenylacetate-coenzyme A ligase PaaK-like adenylate-forming protein